VITFGQPGLNFAVSSSDARVFIAGARPSATAAPPVRLTPVEIVSLFYSLIDQRRFDEAYALLSTRFKAQGTREAFRAGYLTTQGVYVERVQVGSTPSNVQVSILATDLINGQRTVRRFAGTWDLVEEQGMWKLDVGRIQIQP
jgi:hypothetical protein